MSLRDKTIITVGLTILVVIAVIYGISQIILLASFIELEEQFTQQSIDRAIHAINDRINNLDMLTASWAARDQTYELVQSRDQVLFETKFHDETFLTGNLYSVLILDHEGNLLFSQAFDLEKKETVFVPVDLLDHFQPRSQFLDHPDLIEGHKGILLLQEGPLLVAARPIVTSRHEGPAQGTIVFGQKLSDAKIDLISETYANQAALYRLDGLDMSQDIAAVSVELLSASSIIIRPTTSQVIGGYALLNDMYTEPVLLLTVQAPRMIYQQGRASLSYFVFLLFSVGGIVTLIIVILLERQVLSRLAYLSRRVRQIGESGSLNDRIGMTGKDELTQLGGAIDGMLDRMQQAEQKLWYMSTHDTLSDLYNRAFFETELARLERGRNQPISIIMIDIDGLKPTNDTHGHAAGDDLIRRTGQILKTVFRAEDLIARIGGDEFAVILPGVDLEEAEKAHLRVREVLAEQNQAYPHLPLKFSIGLASCCLPGSLVSVMQQADEQMYKEKYKNKPAIVEASKPTSQ
jgi:diguanylate cyclase (GGDEF)-like protein